MQQSQKHGHNNPQKNGIDNGVKQCKTLAWIKTHKIEASIVQQIDDVRVEWVAKCGTRKQVGAHH